LLLPVYDSSSASGPPGISIHSASSTLVGVNGFGVLAPVALPALIAAVVWFALHRKCSRGSRPSGHLAWTCIAALIVFCMAAAASIGIFVLPAAALLAGAAALTPSGTPPALSNAA
jgi:4-amino-4-deoxy-L-arabinose transferase-like glycosyltransferase